jgi:hypothetical protein
MANTAERLDALRDIELLLRGIDLDGLGRLQVRIFNLHGWRTFRVYGLRHGGYDGSKSENGSEGIKWFDALPDPERSRALKREVGRMG